MCVLLVLLNAVTGWVPPYRYIILEGAASLAQPAEAAAPAEAVESTTANVDTTPKPLPPVPNTNRPTQRQIVDYIERAAREQGGDDRFVLFAKALAYSESKIHQFDENDNPIRRLNGEASPTTDVGTFQINNFWHKEVDSNRAGTDWKYNIDQGVRIAKESWDSASGNALQAALNYKGAGKNTAAQQVVSFMSTVINGDDGKPLWQVRVNRYGTLAESQFSLIWPLDQWNSCGEFGIPTSFQPQGHTGIDLCGVPSGTPFKASEDGIVAYAGEWPQGWSPDSGTGHGWTVWIFHGTVEGQNLFTSYGHASKLLVKKGDTVTKGQTIALVGSTGASSGPHIHFEVRIGGGVQYQGSDDFGNWSGGQYQNPRNWISTSRQVTQPQQKAQPNQPNNKQPAPTAGNPPTQSSPGQSKTVNQTVEPTNPIRQTGTFTITLRDTWAVDLALWMRDRHKDLRTQVEFLDEVVGKKKELDQNSPIPLPGMGIEQVADAAKSIRSSMKTLEDIQKPVAFLAISGQPIGPINPNGVTLDPWILYGILMDPPGIAIAPSPPQSGVDDETGPTPIPAETGPRINTLPANVDITPQIPVKVTGQSDLINRINKIEVQRFLTKFELTSLDILIADDQRCYDPGAGQIALGCTLTTEPKPIVIISPRSFGKTFGEGSANNVMAHEFWHAVQRWAPSAVVTQNKGIRIVGENPSPAIVNAYENDAKVHELELAPQFKFMK